MANEHFFPADFAGFAVPFADAAFGFGFHPANDQPAESSATAHFDSALSSLVSSPANGTFAPDDDAALGDLIGRLGSICSGGGANASCYSTPLSSPHRGPAARAHGGLSRVSSSKSLGASAMAPDNAPQYNEAEMSSKQAIQPRQDPPVKAAGDGSGRKRKAATGTAKGKASTVKTSTAAESDSSPKRSKVDGDGAERKEEKGGGEAKAAAPEPPKDYIHVRARRGQATDTHSLAERVRRERISERMRMLQSLVPGCNKITGKAVMLDEIINYVQSLQRQVEFLSMKLATMNPHLDFNGQCLQPRDMHQVAMVPGYPPDAAFSHAPPPRCSLLHDPFGASVHDGLAGKPPPLDSFGGDAFSQVGAFWEHDLQSVVQMGAGQSQDAAALSLQSFYGPAPANHMKVKP